MNDQGCPTCSAYDGFAPDLRAPFGGLTKCHDRWHERTTDQHFDVQSVKEEKA